MRSISVFLGLLVVLVAPSCQDSATEPTGPYDYMFLERTGAMDLGFNVIPNSTVDSFQVQVTHLEFRDTTVEIVLVRSDINAKAFDALLSALRGELRITGDFRQSPLPTGTWVRIYMIKGQGKFEVTEVDLRNELLQFEQLVRNQLDIGQPLAP